jgi:hypothetical protein
MPFLILFVLVFCGCATTAKYEEKLNIWIGASADNLIATWGRPHDWISLANGERVLEYLCQANSQPSSETCSVPQTAYLPNLVGVTAYGGGISVKAYGISIGAGTAYLGPAYNTSSICTTRFIVDSQGIIRRWTWQGNNCKSR